VLQSLGMSLQNGKMLLPKTEAFSWLQASYPQLIEAGFEISQQVESDGKKYF
jgi:hypothetical protein